jgi:protein-S-isoprenylcysteine O-methyltransferase Ste14
MGKLILFIILSIPVVIISWNPLRQFKSHGFYRFFSWECIIWLLASNYRFWFDNPFGTVQIFSWILLIASIYPLIAGIIQIKKVGKPHSEREETGLYKFEKTTELVDTGIYKHIRHPLYASLLLLTWGIFLKNVTLLLFIISLLSSIFLYLTAKADERECIKYFGHTYKEYMRRSKMFAPFIF